MKKIVGLVAVAALTLAACTSGPTATETGVPTPSITGTELQVPEDLMASSDPCKTTQTVAGKKPGELISGFYPIPYNWSDDTTDINGDMQPFTAYRVVYASILRDENDIVPVCGTVVLPKQMQASPIKVLNWTHGTVGLTEKCAPFRKPTGMTQDIASGGLGNDGAGFSAFNEFIKANYLILATDYYTGLDGKGVLQPYAAGIAEAAQALDLMRAVTSIYATPRSKPEVHYATWGHSQGGGSALWVGQIAATYLSDPTFVPKAVVAAAPAGQFVATPEQPAAWVGKHLGDRDAYNFYLGKAPIGDFLFSYVMQAWNQINGAQGKWASIPQNLDLNAVLTPKAQVASDKVAREVCLDNWSKIDAVAPLEPFTRGPAGLGEALPFFTGTVDKMEKLPASGFGGYFNPRHPANAETGNRDNTPSLSNIDMTCLGGGGATAGTKAWCDALAFNMPGPYGKNPNVDKMPATSVPVMVAQGVHDNIVWCMTTNATTTNVDPRECLAAQYVYGVQNATPKWGGTIQANYYATTPAGKKADHFGVMPASSKDSVAFIMNAMG